MSDAFAASGPRTRAAVAFARERHAGQRRETDGSAYVAHPFEVAGLLHECGHDDEVVAAGVLHDVLEDTDTERPELERRFGAGVAALVAALTEDPSIEDDGERKATLRGQVARAGATAAAIVAADKISKVRELRVRAGRAGLDESSAAKVEHYGHSLEMLESCAPDHALVARLRLELDELREVAGASRTRASARPAAEPGPHRPSA